MTPDSFSDGGEYDDAQRAFARGLQCVNDGATILDVGGESTRPGAHRVSGLEQIARVVPAIERLREISGAVISVDTTLSPVASAALDAGASIINDVSGGSEDRAILELAAQRKCGLVLMHRLVAPPDDSYSDQYRQVPKYSNVTAEVCDWLRARVEVAIGAGVDPASIALDPGLGFGKSVEDNFELMAHLDEVVAIGFPVLVSASRKSFLGAVIGQPDPKQRVVASVAVGMAMAAKGAGILRAHDVQEHAQSLRIQAMLRGPG